MHHPSWLRAANTALLLSTTLALGPGQAAPPPVAAFPGPYKPFEVFAEDDVLCRNWAAHSVGMPGNDDPTRTMVGAGQSGEAAWNAQHRYDIAYRQCMYAKGNQVPGVALPPQLPPSAVPPR